jgi:predicted helicase
MERNVNDDYVKFLARAEDLLSAGEDAALGFVVNRSLLASATLRGVRARLLRTFEKIQIVDLGGDAVGGGGNGDGAVDENVFATSQGVGLLLAARSRLPTRHTGKVQYVRFRGNRNEKLAALESAWSSSPDYQTAAAAPPDYRFVVSRNATLWRRFAPIDKLFTVFAEGLKTGFDQGLIGFSAAETREKLNDLRHVSANADALRKKYKVGPRGWADRLLTHPENTSHAAAASPRIVRFAYRPLDFRYCPWPSALLKSPSTVAGRHLDARRNLCLIVTRQVAGPAEVSHFYVSRAVPDNRLLYSRRGSATYFPLYAAEAAESGERRSLLKQEEMNRFASRLGFQWVDDGPGDLIQTLGPESFLHFTYAVLHAPTYRRSFADALRGSFPRIPPARDCEAFRASCQLGADLVALHLAEPDYAAASWNRASQSGSGRPFETWRATAGLPSSASVLIESSVGGTHDVETNRVGRGFPKYTDGRVWINPRQAIGPVDEEIWQFRIGGYQIAHKWLKDRRGRVLTATEIEAYLTLLSIQCETIRLMQRVDSIALRFQLFDESANESSVTGSRP